MLTVPNSDELEAAIRQLDLHVSLDFYVNETNKYADYILPATTMLERDDLPTIFAACSPVVFAQSTEAVLKPLRAGPAGMGDLRRHRPSDEAVAVRHRPLQRLNPVLAFLDRRGLTMTPRRLMAMLLRTGPYGDRFGLRRGGLNLDKLRAHPHGLVLSEHAPTGVLDKVVRHPGGKVRLDPPEIVVEVGRLGTRGAADPSFRCWRSGFAKCGRRIRGCTTAPP